jgi:hypothetical protein
VPTGTTGITGNSVVAVNPATGAVGTAVNVGSQPSSMAETSDGDYIYIGLSGANSIAKFNLLTQSVTATIPVTYQSSSTPPLSLAAMPGTDDTLAIGLNSGYSFGIFDVSGNTGTFRPNVEGYYGGINPVFASPTELYAFDSQTTGAQFYRYAVNANGITLIDGTTLDGMGGFQGGFQLTNGTVYGYGGGIVNPNTTPPTQIETLPLFGSYGESYGIVADPSLQKEFVVSQNLNNGNGYGLVRYDLTSYLPETLVELPASPGSIDSPWTMQRFGQDGIVLLNYDTLGVSTPSVEFLLLRGPFVAPQELATSTAATLSSSSASSLTHGSGNTTLTLTGSNFLPGVAVTWNGSYRTTTVVDSGHVTVLIPASDLAVAGTASLIATNPGAAASSALTVTIN